VTTANGLFSRYLARRWKTVPVHRPDSQTGGCSCGKADCAKPGKHPDGRFWPGGSDDPAHFEGRNLGVQLGPVSQDLCDIDLDCIGALAAAPYLLPATDCGFGRGNHQTHHLYTVTDQAATFAKLQDPALPGDRATIIELRWPEWDEAEQRFKSLQTVFPPSLHHTGATLRWLRHGEPAVVAGADLNAAVRHVAAAVLLARHAKPKVRHDLVLLTANLLVRAGWSDDAKVVRFLAAVFAARKDADKVAKIEGGEGVGAVKDARNRLKTGKSMTGLPALQKMLDPALEAATAEKVVARVKEWLGVPDPPAPEAGGTGPTRGKPTPPPRYSPLPPWRPFPTDHLPRAVREFVLTVSRAMRCDTTFVALPALAACAGMIGGTRQIRLKQSWHEPAVTWAVVVGDSGTLKTPPYKRAVAPVVALQAAHLREHAAASEQYRAELREYEREKRRAKDDDPGDPPVEPPCTRVYSRDTTVEALAGILMQNRSRFLIGRDELSGWLASFNQYKAKGGSDQANWLELHGLGTLCVDRKTGEPKTIFVRGVGVSLCGGIQPGVLRAALSPQHFSAGVPARLLFAYPPRRPKEWTEDDIDEAAEANYHRLIRGLAGLHPHTDDDGEPFPVTLGMTPEAKAEWVRFYGRFARKQAETEGELAAAFSKLEGYAARLALVHHVCQSVDAGSDALKPVAVESLRAGIALAEWFTAEAERVYQMLGEETEEEETRKLVDVVNRLAERHGGRVTAKHLQRSNQRKYRSAEAATAALDSLAGLGLGRWEEIPPGPRGGRPTRTFVPCVTRDETDETPGAEDASDRPDDGLGGDDTPDGVTKPPSGGDGASDVNPSPANGLEAGTADEAGVSSVSSRVTRDVGGREQTPDQPPFHTGGFVTHGWEVSSPPGCTLVTAAEGVAMVAGVMRGWAGPVGLDTETTGLDPARDRVRLVQVALGDDTCVIDLFALADPAAALAPLFAALAEKEVVGHNLQFDLRMLAPLGFVPGRVFDTMLASRVLHAGERTATNARLRHGLEDAAERELGRTLDKTQQDSDWSGPLTSEQLAYAAGDAAVLVPLAEVLKSKLAAANLTDTAALEMRALPGVTWCAPVAVDATAWTAQAQAAEAEQARLQERMDLLAPNPACLPGAESRNWNSTDDVRAAFAELGIALDSTDDSALAATDHPLAALVREYRGVAKRVGTYGRSWMEKHVGADGRVLPSWNQLGAESGRMSCSDPNLQQIPRGSHYRRCFVAGPGMVLVKADYSQIELRIAAKIASEEVMIDAYRAGGDLHRLTAARVLGKAEGEVTKADRQIAKSLNFGLLYGMGWRGLKGYALANYGVSLTDDQARAYREAFFQANPALRDWHRRVGNEVERRFQADPTGTHEVRTLGGRRRVLPIAKKRENGTPYPNVTDALNTPVQGTGADGLKAAIARLWQTRAECTGAKPVIYCHDEVVLEVPAREHPRVAEWLRRCMVEAVAPLLDPVPVEVEVTAGPTWGG
jgi:DNA polymerase I-like protein with 3'-5' exonuclease and polymerase domains